MFPQLASSGLTRVSSLVGAVDSDAHIYDDPNDANIPALLDSRYEAEKIQGLKCLIALLAQGKDVSGFFPQVVKNVASPSLEVKKLIYIYLVHYADKRPDEALLSVNSFQKDLSDQNPMVRAWALRAMSGIRVHAVVPLVIMAANKCARDPSPYVRRCTANAIRKIHAMDHGQYQNALEELICILLSDNCAAVVGAAAAAFATVCPEHLSLLSTRTKNLCEILPEVDEWGQVVLMDILLRYIVAKHGLPEHSAFICSEYGLKLAQTSHSNQRTDRYSDVLSNSVDEQQDAFFVNKRIAFGDIGGSEDSNLLQKMDIIDDSGFRLVLRCTYPLLWSNNSAVVLAAAGVHWLLSSVSEVSKIVKPLIFVLRSAYESQYVVLANIQTFAKAMPSLFEPYFDDFFISEIDTQHIRFLKLDILTLIATESSILSIYDELQVYTRSPDYEFAAASVNAIGRCAIRLPSIVSTCAKHLLGLAIASAEDNHNMTNSGTGEPGEKSGSGQGVLIADRKLTLHVNRRDAVVTQAVIALRTIVQQCPNEQEKVLVHLLCHLNRIKVSAARSVAVWMLGEHCATGRLIPAMLPVLLRYLGGVFTTEADETKLQILNCVAKVAMNSDMYLSLNAVPLALHYILNLGICDTNYDVRDRARMLQLLLKSFLEYSKEENNIHDAELFAAVEVVEDGSDCQSIKTSILRSYQKLLCDIAKSTICSAKEIPYLSSASLDRPSFLPGSMSHIMQHIAPNYWSLPPPHSLKVEDTDLSNAEESKHKESKEPHRADNHSEYSGSTRISSGNYSTDSAGENSDDGNDDVYSTESEIGDDGIYSTGSEDNPDRNLMLEDFPTRRKGGNMHKDCHQDGHVDDSGPLIFLSDTEIVTSESRPEPHEFVSTNLENWLESSATFEEGLKLPKETTVPILVHLPLFEPRKNVLLDFTDGRGLEVQYCFSREASAYSQSMICIRLFFHNRSSESMTDISVGEHDSSKLLPSSSSSLEPSTMGQHRIILSPDSIINLNPSDKVECDLYADFKDRFKPLKLCIFCNGNTFPVKLVPELGAFIYPVPMRAKEFTLAQSAISGMHESSRRIKVPKPVSAGLANSIEEKKQVAYALVQKVVNAAHLSLVSATVPVETQNMDAKDSPVPQLSIFFSGKTVDASSICLLTVLLLAMEQTVDTHPLEHDKLNIDVKVNCDDPLFGLALLNVLVRELSTP